MNTTPAVSHTPIVSDPAQLSPAASVNSANCGGRDGNFAAALSKAGARPARKTAARAAGGSGSDGGQLPVVGNVSPPPATAGVPAGATSDGAAAARTGSNDAAGSTTTIGPVGGGSASQSAAPGSATVAGAAPKAADQSAAGAATGSTTLAKDVQGAVDLAATFSAPLGLPAGAGEPGAGAPVASNADPGPLAGTGSAGTPLAGTTPDSRSAQNTPPVQGMAPPKSAPAANPGRAAPTATAATAANDAATSAPSSAAGGAATGGTVNGAVNGADASAQAAIAVAIAAARGVVADGAAITDATLSAPPDSAIPAAGAKGAAAAKAAAGANGLPAPGLLVAGGRLAAAAEAATAAVAGSVGTGGADKHTGSGNADSMLSDASAGSAGAAQFPVNAPGATDVAAAPTLKVAAAVDTPEFGQGLADRVSWMVDNNLSSAKLQINPPQLGPIEVRISVQGDHAQVWLASHSALTRDALESNSPKLREMLGAQGFAQVSVDVSQRNFQDRSAHAQPYQWTPATNLSASAAVPVAAVSLPRLSSGVVDAYA